MTRRLPELSRLELHCLRRLWSLGEASVRNVQESLDDEASYSTVRKIFERLEEKKAVERVRRDGAAWIYRSQVSAPDMIRKEIRRLVDVLFDGAGGPLVAHLADMDAISLDDLRAVESRLDKAGDTSEATESPDKRPERRNGKAES